MFSKNKCKCCGDQDTKFLGSVPFNKSCHDRFGNLMFPQSQELVPYNYCKSCGFIFSIYMDEWSDIKMKQVIYNEDYHLADGPVPGSDDEKCLNGYLDHTYRSGYKAGLELAKLLGNNQSLLKILEYGSGLQDNPQVIALRDCGFNVTEYDPYRNNLAEKVNLELKYDVIILDEVIEHITDLNSLRTILSTLLTNNGLLKIGVTLFQVPFNSDILSHWYIAPRNGHISIFNLNALTELFIPVNISIALTRHGIIGFKNRPNFKNAFLC